MTLTNLAAAVKRRKRELSARYPPSASRWITNAARARALVLECEAQVKQARESNDDRSLKAALRAHVRCVAMEESALSTLRNFDADESGGSEFLLQALDPLIVPFGNRKH